MDCQMPGLSGNDATRRIREQEQQGGNGLPPVYIIAMTASTVDGDRAACRAAGMDGYLTKPVMLADLRAALEEAAAGVASVPVKAVPIAPPERQLVEIDL